ncbi:protein kinase domain-containing protein [Krasilnikoviella flava]|uniref:non-specific serine/threonine protein kinase n=1 Tax=Krasilnikoviella flava TaxID=526729 RepID=A0A1T5J803_9MICO|nr:protein kinase [Krasilnikoviella flava]SKC47677.1 Serine/threonine protein kinase [Krasilnikoviella flava]
MSSKRAPSAPPEIPGYTYRKVIGTGGFSDVFLYEQHRPRRQVAVKVLLKEWSSDTQRTAFDAEADLMATLGNHPSIVTMYEAGVAPDGRPYLALEYCSRPNLGARYRSERMSLPEAMRTTIQIAGAVETSHRLGILHRDIKPANILVTQFGHPALTDFGISSTVDAASAAEGMSIPWSPPESFGDPPVSGIATDVWALGATCYTLLAGRTPFEVPGGSNSSADLMGRIATAPLAEIGRGDVPESLERVLRIAMAKRPESRYPTALSFARAVQQVQVELARDMTPIDLLDETGLVLEDEDEAEGTRMNRVRAIDPDQRGGGSSSFAAPPAASVPFAPAPAAPAGTGAPQASPVGLAATGGTSGWSVPATASPSPGLVPTVDGTGQQSDLLVDETVFRTERPAAATEDAEADAEASTASRWAWLLVAIGSVLVLGIGGLIWWLSGDDEGGPSVTDPGTSQTAAPADPIGGYVPPVQELQATVEGKKVVVTWEAPREAEEGDTFGWKELSLSSESQYTQTEKATASVAADKSQDVCVEVVVIRGSSASEAQRTCVLAGADASEETTG